MDKISPINEEYIFDKDAVLISQTDLEGTILFVNQKFQDVSGYSYNELVGKPYNILRHPDMPEEVFEKMWETLKSGQVYNGIIKNLRKDGKYYWIDLEILPIKEENSDTIKTYMAVARKASKKDIEENQLLYNKY
ncbi:MAG: PAS domain S-box protein [Epsilonproteobacteria bacterium]|nr:PAS domain S-box protein [Campylobacterota bacterium]